MTPETVRQAWVNSELKDLPCEDCRGSGKVHVSSDYSSKVISCFDCGGSGTINREVFSLTAMVKDDFPSIDYPDDAEGDVRVSAEDFDRLYHAYRTQVSHTKTIRDKAHTIWRMVLPEYRPDWKEPTTVSEALEMLDSASCSVLRECERATAIGPENAFLEVPDKH